MFVKFLFKYYFEFHINKKFSCFTVFYKISRKDTFIKFFSHFSHPPRPFNVRTSYLFIFLKASCIIKYKLLSIKKCEFLRWKIILCFYTLYPIPHIVINKIITHVIFLLYMFQVAEMTLWIMMTNNSPKKVQKKTSFTLHVTYILYSYRFYSPAICEIVQMRIDC